MAVYYYVMENNMPSWGTGMIYYHVWLLHKNNIEAYVLHDKANYRLPWLELDVPIKYINNKSLSINLADYLVIPEFYADNLQLQKYKCKKIVFVQNAFYIFDGLKNIETYEELGISQVFYYMPHLKKTLRQVTDLPLFETPPFIAPYFFTKETEKERQKRIIIYPKHNNRDYLILKRMLQQKLNLAPKNGFQKLFKKDNWELIELKDKTHHQVAKEMQQATFFISLNTTEAFNSSVPEAMAAGCINICYEGVGPADFLVDGRNAFVFSNNHVYNLVEKLSELLRDYDNKKTVLDRMRLAARQTAEAYKIAILEKSMLSFFSAADSVV